MNRRGQALVEFILILPIFIMLMFVIIDFGMVFNEKNKLENKSMEIIEFINQRKEIDEIKTMYPDYDISVNNKDDYIVVAISSKVNLITPGSSIILDNPFPIKRYLAYCHKLFSYAASFLLKPAIHAHLFHSRSSLYRYLHSHEVTFPPRQQIKSPYQPPGPKR